MNEHFPINEIFKSEKQFLFAPCSVSSRGQSDVLLWRHIKINAFHKKAKFPADLFGGVHSGYVQTEVASDFTPSMTTIRFVQKLVET